MKLIKRSLFWLSVIAACLPPIAAFATGPTGTYYLTAGEPGGTNWAVQGNAVVNSWPQHHPESGGEYAIAVSSTVRTLGSNQITNHPGSEYTLNGTYTGTDYAYPSVTNRFYDGTTDGSFNYSVDYSGGGVYRMNSDWSQSTLLFNSVTNALGITYDPSNNSLWISSFNTNTVVDYSLTGTPLSSFSVPFSKITCLALDPADQTLWMGSQSTEGTFYQYSKAGAQLNTQFYSALANQNTLGGEFAVPEPGTIGLLGLGSAVLVLGAWRRRKWAAK